MSGPLPHVSAQFGEAPDPGYQIPNSALFRPTAYLYKSDYGTAVVDIYKFIISLWFKITERDLQSRTFISGGNDSSNFTYFRLDFANRLEWNTNQGGATRQNVTTDPIVFQDPSAWQHILLSFDGQNATQDLKLRIWHNRKLLPLSFVNWSGGIDYAFLLAAGGTVNRVGTESYSTLYPLAAYLAQFIAIESNIITDSGTYQIDHFSEEAPNGDVRPVDTSSVALPGNSIAFNFDNSANFGESEGSFNWLNSGGLVAADQVTDTPTNNFVTLNPLDNFLTLSNGNTGAAAVDSNWRATSGTIGLASGKWYFEYKPATIGSGNEVGHIMGVFFESHGSLVLGDWPGSSTDSMGLQYGAASAYTVNKYGYGGTLSPGAWNLDVGHTLLCAMDLDARKIWFGATASNFGADTNAWWDFGTANTDPETGVGGLDLPPTGLVFPGLGIYLNGTGNMHFREETWTHLNDPLPYVYDPPAGFNPISTANLPEPAIKDGREGFHEFSFLGNGTAQTLNDLGWGSDNQLFWFKNRSAGLDHFLSDTRRGVINYWSSNSTGIGEQQDAQGVTAFSATGCSVGSSPPVNGNGNAVSLWRFRIGGAPASTTAPGTITTDLSVDTVRGMSCAMWTGTGANGTIAHGLPGLSEWVIIQNRDATWNNYSYHHYMNAAPQTGYMELSGDNAFRSDAAIFNTAATTQVFGVSGNTGVNGSGDNMIAYAFTSIPGFSKFGTFTGPGADLFLYLGFKPRWVFIKRLDGAGGWSTLGFLANSLTNPANLRVVLDDWAVQSANGPITFLANGLLIETGWNEHNNTGFDYIYGAFAENPLGGVNTTPATAR